MRTKRGFTRKRHVKRVLKAAKGYRGGRSKLFRSAKETVQRAWWYSKGDRRHKKGDFRRLWIARINAAARMRGFTYSRLIDGLNKAGVELDRKVLADLALTDEQAFDRICEVAQRAL